MATHWHERFFASTRGQIIALLCRGSRTVDDLAQSLSLTDNAVRAHLATLERDGFVKQEGVRRGAGKPAFAYELTPEAERLFPKPYGRILHQLLDVLAARLTPDVLEEVLREVGHRVAAGHQAPPGNLRGRAEYALTLLGDLGGLGELEERDAAFVIRGYSCPVGAAVPGHPQMCLLAETLLADVVGAPVRERCDRGDPPRCCFEVSMAADPAIHPSHPPRA
ncbi:MAG: ArsR family transcriptional regulator [Chloroflexi bacterium]|nr:ArsR family transcriptional regulator [Chloroflexota bacterium]